MKKLFLGLLVFNLLLEGFAAISLISAPGAGLPGAGPAEISWARNYGFAALAMASLIVWIWPQRNNAAAVSTVLGLLMVFHLGISLSLTLGMGPMLFATLHGLGGLVAVVLFATRSRWLRE